MSRDRGKPIRDQTGLICFFYKKIDSVLKKSLSIEYHTKSDPPLDLERLPIAKVENNGNLILSIEMRGNIFMKNEANLMEITL